VRRWQAAKRQAQRRRRVIGRFKPTTDGRFKPGQGVKLASGTLSGNLTNCHSPSSTDKKAEQEDPDGPNLARASVMTRGVSRRHRLTMKVKSGGGGDRTRRSVAATCFQKTTYGFAIGAGSGTRTRTVNVWHRLAVKAQATLQSTTSAAPGRTYSHTFAKLFSHSLMPPFFNPKEGSHELGHDDS
jgi:hypothetical protein